MFFKKVSEEEHKKASKYVSIDTDGNLYLINAIDYEKFHKIELSIKIFDKSSTPLNIIKRLSINIININDNHPSFVSFENSPCQFEVYEGALKSKIIHKFDVTDLDAENDKRQLEFKIVEVTSKQKISNKNQFYLNENSGELSILSPLDRETIDNYKILISVKDLEILGVQLESNLECEVKVLDINDNSPKFVADKQNEDVVTQFTILPLINQVTFINWFKVIDVDFGRNATIEFKLEAEDEQDSKLFSIDSNGYFTMRLMSHSKNNPDLNSIYNFKLIATDMGNMVRLNSSLHISVEINRNYFKFNQQENNKLELDVASNIINIDENSAKGVFITKVKVTNSFDGVIKQRNKEAKSVKLKFRLLTCNETFIIDETTGVINVLNSSNLDYEAIKEFRLSVEATEVVKSMRTENELSFERNCELDLNIY